MDYQVVKPIFCDLPDSSGVLVPHIIHGDYQYYLTSKFAEGKVYFHCKNDLCKAKVEVTYYRKNFPAKSKIPFKEDHELISGDTFINHTPCKAEIVVNQTLRDIKATLEEGNEDKLKTVYAQCVNKAMKGLKIGTEEISTFSTAMPKFIQLEMTMKTWKNNATPLNASKDSLSIEDNNEVIVYDDIHQVQDCDDNEEDNIQIIEDNNQSYPEPSSEERETPKDNSEAHVITLDDPVLSNHVLETDDQSPKKARRGRPRNWLKEIQDNILTHPERESPLDSSEAQHIIIEDPLLSNPVSFKHETDQQRPKERRGRPKGSKKRPKEIQIDDSDEDDILLEEILEKVPDNQEASNQDLQLDVDEIPHENYESTEQRFNENEQQNHIPIELNDSNSVKLRLKNFFIKISREEKSKANDCYDPEYWRGRLPVQELNEIFMCGVCNNTFNDLATLKTHSRQYGHVLASQYQTNKRKSDQETCLICNKTFKSNRGYVIHHKKVHVNNIDVGLENSPAQEEFTDADVHFVEYSGSEDVNDNNSEGVIELIKEDPYRTNEIVMDLPNHISNSSSKSVEYDSVVIDDDIEYDEDLVELTDDSNPTDAIFTTFTKAGVIKAPTFCAICRLGFPSRNFVLQHIADYHKFQPAYTCDECRLSFAFYFQYNKHMFQSHESSQENKPYKIQCVCEVCGLKFDSQILYRKHRKGVHPDFAFKCDKCDCRYPERAVLLEHMRTKHGIPINNIIDNTAMKVVEISSVEKHKCDRCDALFLSKDQLTIHKTSHMVGLSNSSNHVPDRTAYTVLNVIRSGLGGDGNNSKSIQSLAPRRVSVDEQELPMINLVLPRSTNNSPTTTESCGNGSVGVSGPTSSVITLEAQEDSTDEDIEMLEDPSYNVKGTKPKKAKTRKRKTKTTFLQKKQMPPLLPLTKNSVFVDKPFACDMCPESFSQKIVLSMHKQLNHLEANPIFSAGSPDQNKTVKLKTNAIAPQTVPKNNVMVQPNGDVIVTSNANVMMTSNPNIMMTSNGMLSSNYMLSSNNMLPPNNMLTLNDPEMISNSAPDLIVGDDSDTFLYTREQLEAENDDFHDDIAEHYQDDIAAADDDILILEDDADHHQEVGVQDIHGQTEFEEERVDIKDENIDIHHTPIIDHVDSILSI